MNIKIGGQFSGVGSFDMAFKRLNIDFENVYQAEWDKYARQTYLLNNEAPKWYVEDVYDTPIQDIPQLDIAMFSPPCQSFSLAGKRQGENSDKGILFYASHEFIEVNKPRYFIFENVKGLLSDDGGKTFQKWIDYLGGKSVNGNHTLFPHEKSVPYHVYYQVMNAKHYGVPQNRERIFIIGIRDDDDNDFQFPKKIPLEKRLKDVLESEVDEKYFLGEKTLDYFQRHLELHKEKGNGFGFKTQTEEDTHANSVTTKYGTRQSDTYLKVQTAPIVEYQLTGGKWDKTHEQSGRVYDKNGISPTIHTMQGGNQEPKILTDVKQINLSKESGGKQPFQHNRVYEGDIVGTLDTECGRPSYVVPNEIIVLNNATHSQQRIYSQDGISPSILSGSNGGGQNPCKHLTNSQRIRRLTPKECFRLMDFNEDFIDRTINSKLISDSQMYKQAGNSIVVSCLVEIIKKLKLCQQNTVTTLCQAK